MIYNLESKLYGPLEGEEEEVWNIDCYAGRRAAGGPGGTFRGWDVKETEFLADDKALGLSTFYITGRSGIASFPNLRLRNLKAELVARSSIQNAFQLGQTSEKLRNILTLDYPRKTNLAALTQSHKAIAAKRKLKCYDVKEVLFDDNARREYLTGFHKRKKAKADAAREKAKEREKQEKLQDRRERRQQLREQAIENATQVEKAYGAISNNVEEDFDDEWQGVGTSSAGMKRDEEYEGEQVIATVTVIEDFDPASITTGPIPPQTEMTRNASSSSIPSRTSSSKPTSSSKTFTARPKGNKVKKVHYETKSARKAEKDRQHKRKLEKASLAGSRSRKSKSKSTR